MARHLETRRLATFTAFLAVMIVTLAPVHGAFAACCCPSLSPKCAGDACSSGTAAGKSCCGHVTEELVQSSCCSSTSTRDVTLAGDGGWSLCQSCDCDGCGCDLVAAERSVATVENSTSFAASALNQLDGEPLIYAAITPVRFDPPMLALSAHESCVRLCRWLN